MATIYIIAGPPGIGKSTSGSEFIPDDIPVLDPDIIAQKYRKQGFVDYKDIGEMSFRKLLRWELVSCKDFALELNLGYQAHYDLIKNIKGFSPDNRIEVILFHTDDINICLDRARIRHEEGLHLVPPETVKEMYDNTIPLLKQNLSVIAGLRAVNVKGNNIFPKAVIDYTNANLNILDELPKWLDKELIEQLSVSTLKNTSKEKPHPKKIPPPKKNRGRRM